MPLASHRHHRRLPQVPEALAGRSAPANPVTPLTYRRTTSPAVGPTSLDLGQVASPGVTVRHSRSLPHLGQGEGSPAGTTATGPSVMAVHRSGVRANAGSGATGAICRPVATTMLKIGLYGRHLSATSRRRRQPSLLAPESSPLKSRSRWPRQVLHDCWGVQRARGRRRTLWPRRAAHLSGSFLLLHGHAWQCAALIQTLDGISHGHRGRWAQPSQAGRLLPVPAARLALPESSRLQAKRTYHRRSIVPGRERLGVASRACGTSQ